MITRSSPRTIPYVIASPKEDADLSSYVSSDFDGVRDLVLRQGAVLFRGFSVKTHDHFQSFIDALAARKMDYRYRSTPRTRVNKDVLTATEYPPQLQIPLHCENAYQRSWPLWISLCCLAPAWTGGQTPIADMSTVTRAIDANLLDRFATRQVKYIRNFRPHVDLSWEEVFQTKDRSEVARYCKENDIDHRWLEGDILRTEQVCQGVADHPSTKETIFFNQAHLFHPSSLGEMAERALIKAFGTNSLPRNACYGDDTQFEPGELAQIRAAFDGAAIDVSWQQGDVLLLDNMQVAHGRRAFTGARRVLASLLNPYTP